MLRLAHAHPDGKHSELRAELASRLHAAAGLGLYLLTLAGEVVLGAGVRWLLIYLGAVVLGAVVPLGPGAEQLALLTALLPLVVADWTGPPWPRLRLDAADRSAPPEPRKGRGHRRRPTVAASRRSRPS